MGRFNLDPICAGWLEGGSPAGGTPAPYVSGMTAVADGSGGWFCTPNQTPGEGLDPKKIVITAFPAPGSNLPGGVSWGVSESVDPDTGFLSFGLFMYRVDTGVQIDFAMYVKVERREDFPWD